MARNRKDRKQARKGREERAGSSRLAARLRQADRLVEAGQWEPARQLLHKLHHRHRGEASLLRRLAAVQIRLGDMEHYQQTCQRLVAAEPDDPHAKLALATAYLKNVRPACAVRTYRELLSRWPDHAEAESIRENVSVLQEEIGRFMENHGLPDKDDLDFPILHEQLQSQLATQRYGRARETAERLLERKPDFLPGLNNLSLCLFAEGEIREAISKSEEALRLESENVNALTNLVHFSLMSGMTEEARAYGERLKAVTVITPELRVKQAEGLSYLGDDEGVVDAYRSARRDGFTEDPLVDRILYHLAAAALLRLGQEGPARSCWRKALNPLPDYELAKENLADLRKPIGERHGPWAFSINEWMSSKTFRELVDMVLPAARSGKDAEVKRVMRRFLGDHPEIYSLMPILFERGDPAGRGLMFTIASTARTPECLAALKDFALGRWGPDEQRSRAGQILTEEGLLSDEPVTLWHAGELREVRLREIEISGSTSYKMKSPRAERLLNDGATALQMADVARAKRLIQEALQLEPGAPPLLNNLAGAYALDGRDREAKAIIDQLMSDHPDYIMAPLNAAQRLIYKGDLRGARKLLEPLRSRGKFSYPEFRGIVTAWLMISLAEGTPEQALPWIDMWEGAGQQDPTIGRLRREVEKALRERGQGPVVPA